MWNRFGAKSSIQQPIFFPLYFGKLKLSFLPFFTFLEGCKLPDLSSFVAKVRPLLRNCNVRTKSTSRSARSRDGFAQSRMHSTKTMTKFNLVKISVCSRCKNRIFYIAVGTFFLLRAFVKRNFGTNISHLERSTLL